MEDGLIEGVVNEAYESVVALSLQYPGWRAHGPSRHPGQRMTFV